MPVRVPGRKPAAACPAAAQRHRADDLNSPFRAVPRLSRPGLQDPGRRPAGARRAGSAVITARKLVPMPPFPLPDKLYAAIDGTGVPMPARETAGRPRQGRGRPRPHPRGQARRVLHPGQGLIRSRAATRPAWTRPWATSRTTPPMRGKWSRSRGLFAGSGAVEAGCEAVIGQRLKLSGMRWTVAGAITALRCRDASSQRETICRAPHNQTGAAQPGNTPRRSWSPTKWTHTPDSVSFARLSYPRGKIRPGPNHARELPRRYVPR